MRHRRGNLQLSGEREQVKLAVEREIREPDATQQKCADARAELLLERREHCGRGLPVGLELIAHSIDESVAVPAIPNEPPHCLAIGAAAAEMLNFVDHRDA